MSIDLKVYDNGDHTCLVWLPSDEKPLPNCRGFSIRRLLNNTENYLHGFVGFSDTDKLDPAAPWKFPLQRYMWWDYGVRPGDVVQYSVVPVVGSDKDHLALAATEASALTPPMTVTGQCTKSVSAYFNKGIVAAQWVAHALAQLGKNPKMAEQIAAVGNPLRNALSGLARTQLLALLDDVAKNNGEIYAALYELNDPEIIPKLTALGQKCHLLLANGAFKPPTNDENRVVRQSLEGKVDLKNRMVSSGHFAHNKFLVVCDASGTPQRVLTGSLNWTMTGLCTQANNCVVVDSPELASAFLDEWKRLQAAGNGYPPTLAQANSTPATVPLDGGQITQWFAPTDNAVDLEYARKLINAAQEGILFLFFNPGTFQPADKPLQWTLLQNIIVRHQEGTPNYNPNLYMRGVVNQRIAGLTGPADAADAKDDTLAASPHGAHDPANASPVTLFSGGTRPPQRLPREAMLPAAIKDVFHNWDKEMLGTGVHIHSKVIVLDPFGEKPVVMTGSHNLGYKASHANDDNLMIVEGNAALAAAFAVNIIAIYQSYRWNAYVEAHRQDPQVWHGLVDNDTWQNGYLSGSDLAELKFWLGETASASAAPAAGATGAPAAPVKAVRSPAVAPPKPAARPGRARTVVTVKPSAKAAVKSGAVKSKSNAKAGSRGTSPKAPKKKKSRQVAR